jgi:hypothetical protein
MLHTEKEAIKRKRVIYDGRKASTLPRKFSLSSSSPKESVAQRAPKMQAHQKVQRTYSPPHDPYEYDFPSKTVDHPEITDHDPILVHPPTNTSLTRNGYSHSHALNKIRRDLNSTLHPPNSVTKAWHSNPSTRTSSRNPSQHGSRNPSRTPSRAPSGASIRTPLSGSSHLEDILDDDVEDLTFHEVESHTLVMDSHSQRKRAFSIGADSTETIEENDHLPSLPSPQHTSGPPPTRSGKRRAHSDVSGLRPQRNGFQSQTVTLDLPTDLDSDAIITEFVRVAEQLKMRHMISSKSMVDGVLKGVRLQIHVKKVQHRSCHVAFQWVCGGEFKTYREVCDSFMVRTHI